MTEPTQPTKSKAEPKIHSVDYIRAVKEYLKLRTIEDDLTRDQQFHLAYLAFLTKANGTASVGYDELVGMRLGRTTISDDNRKFKALGIISKVDVGHANQFDKKGVVSRFYFDLDAILALNARSAESRKQDSANGGAESPKPSAESPNGSAESPNQSAESPKGAEPVSLTGLFLKVLPLKDTIPEKTLVLNSACPDAPPAKSGGSGVSGSHGEQAGVAAFQNGVLIGHVVAGKLVPNV
jgi:hypothetical protein